MRDIDTMAIKAKSDHKLLEQLILSNEYHILKSASLVTHRFITKSDDEWSVALMAYTQAVDTYEPDKGSFIKFAELVIKRRLIDYIRSQNKYSSEIYVDPYVFDTGSEEEDEDNTLIRKSIAKQFLKEDGSQLKLEIEAANHSFSCYGFSFFDLTECSPKAKKTKANCAKAVNYMLDNPDLIRDMRNNKLLPIKAIEKNTHVPRKILERHRKYIVAAIEILSGEYPHLAEYLRYVREER